MPFPKHRKPSYFNKLKKKLKKKEQTKTSNRRINTLSFDEWYWLKKKSISGPLVCVYMLNFRNISSEFRNLQNWNSNWDNFS